MSKFGKACVVSCLWLVATTSAFGVANPGVSNNLDDETTEPVRPALPPPQAPAMMQDRPVAQDRPVVQDRPVAQDRQVAQTTQPPGGNPLWGIPLKQLSATRDRPIFSPSRRPPPTATAPTVAMVSAPVAQPKQPDRPQLVLVGTIVNGDDGFAIFTDQTTKVPLRIRMGTEYQGWFLRAIKAGSATLQKDQEVAVLAFVKPSEQKAAPGRVFAGANPNLPVPPINPPPVTTSFQPPARPFANSARRR